MPPRLGAMSRPQWLLAALVLAPIFTGCEVDGELRRELSLRIPQRLEPTSSDATTDFFTLTQRIGYQQVVPEGPLTPIKGYDGTWPGPLLEVRRGRIANVTQFNELPHPVVVHNHGHSVEPQHDGHPTDFIMPGDSRGYIYPNAQQGATFFLHDHTMDHTSRNVYDGLATFYNIRDDQWDSLNLPSGEYDVPLLIQDRFLNGDNSLYYPEPQFGNIMMVNGTRTPRMEVSARKYLFRVLNASDLRVLRLNFHQVDETRGIDALEETFQVVASDGGLLSAPVEVNNLDVTHAERYAIVFDFSRYPVGTTIELRNQDAAILPPIFTRLRHVMTFVITDTAQDDSEVPDVLVPVTRLDPATATVTRKVTFSMQNDSQNIDEQDFFINGHFYDPNIIDFQPRLNTTEIWEVENTTRIVHTLHLHLIQFQILDFAGHTPPDEQMGWKDTVLVQPNNTVRIIMRWEGYPGVYVFHCHMLAHEDHAMMAQVEVLP